MLKRLSIVGSSFIILLGFVVFTNPQEISLIVILLPFLLLGAIFYNSIVLIAEKLFPSGKPIKVKLYSLVGTVLILNFALLSSIGQLTVQDTILTALITIVTGFYLYKFQIS